MNEKMNKFIFEGKELAGGITWNMLWIFIGAWIIRGIVTTFIL